MSHFLNTYIKFFFLLTPFFVLSTFLAMTQQHSAHSRRVLAVRVTLAVIVTCGVLVFAGNYLFAVFGITLDSFRVGAGILLFLAGVSLVQGRTQSAPPGADEDVAVVPLAIPITVGPATTGALLVMGVELQTLEDKLIGGISLLLAILTVGAMLYGSNAVQRIVGQKGLSVLSKLTGLILAALSAQMVMAGLRSFGFAH